MSDRLVFDLFQQASRLPESEVNNFLKEHISDETIQEKVLFLLKLQRMGSDLHFLENTPGEAAALEKNYSGTRIGKFEIGELLGSGGIGKVYLGYDQVLHRQVAIKVLRPERRFKQATRERFLREAQILSQLNHPGICGIYDILSTEQDDFIVLEYLDGEILNKKIAESLTYKQKLALILEITDALTASHALNIIHRDLKPENIMVTKAGKVKVLDFGIASFQAESRQVIAPDATTEDTPVPEQSRFMGTPMYMSPEQGRGEILTPKSDIFSLGLVFQTIFSESLPRNNANFKALMLQVRRGETTIGKDIPKPLRRLIQTMTDPEIRNRPTALEVAQEIRNIAARPKVRAKRLVVGAFITVLSLSTLLLAIGSIRLKSANEKAELEAQNSEKVVSFLIGTFRDIAPRTEGKKEMTASELLDRTVASIDDKLADLPEARLRLADAFTYVYTTQGKPEKALETSEKAIELARRSHGSQSLALAYGYQRHGFLLWQLRQFDAAEPYLLQAAAMIGDQGDPANRADLIQLIGRLYLDTGDHEAAEPYIEKATQIRQGLIEPPHPALARGLISFGTIALKRGEFDKAETLFLEALDMFHAALGPDNLFSVVTYNNLGLLHFELGEFQIASDYYQRAKKLTERIVGASHPNMAQILLNESRLYDYSGRVEEALALKNKAYEILEKQYTPQSPYMQHILYYLALFHLEQGNPRIAEPYFAPYLDGPFSSLKPSSFTYLRNRILEVHLLNENGAEGAALDILDQITAHEEGGCPIDLETALKFQELRLSILHAMGMNAAAEAEIAAIRQQLKSSYALPHPFAVRAEFAILDYQIMHGNYVAAEVIVQALEHALEDRDMFQPRLEKLGQIREQIAQACGTN